MKKNIFGPFLISLYSIGMSAQIIVNSSDMPISTDTLRYSMVSIYSPISITSTGANYNWDYSNLKSEGQAIYQYESPSAINSTFGSFFTSSAIGIKLVDSLTYGIIKMYNLYEFYDNTSTQYMSEGIGVTFQNALKTSKYTASDIIYRFPLAYQNSDSAIFKINTSLSLFLDYRQNGKRVNKVDGWGTIQTPYGIFDCIRIKSVIYQNDSIVEKFSNNAYPIKNTLVEYKWLAKNQHYPILYIQGVINTNGQTDILQVSYRDTVRNQSQYLSPTANFISDTLFATVEDTVNLLNHSSPFSGVQNSYQWSFTPAGISFVSGTSNTSANPIILFTIPGLYSIMLSVTNTYGISSATLTNYVSVTPLLPASPDFEADTTFGMTGDTITIENYTYPLLNNSNIYLWTITPSANISFVNNTSDTSASPQIQFLLAGNYTVKLTVTNPLGTMDTTAYNYIQILNVAPPYVDFEADTLSGEVGDTISLFNYTDTYPGYPNTYQWIISPDYASYVNNTSDTSTSPIIVFNDDTVYTIKLIARNIAGEEDATIFNYITISEFTNIKLPTDNSNYLKIYPNPTSGHQINLWLMEPNSGNGKVEIFDIIGNKVYDKTMINLVSGSNKLEDTGNLHDGVYFVKLIQNNTTIIRRIIIRN